MERNTILRWTRIAALAAVMAVPLGSVAWGQSNGYDRDDYSNRHDEAREQGYRAGARDGQRQGQYDYARNRRFKFKTDDWEDSRGFEHWMGNKGQYKHAYRDGYERAYRQAYGSYDRRHDRDGWR